MIASSALRPPVRHPSPAPVASSCVARGRVSASKIVFVRAGDGPFRLAWSAKPDCAAVTGTQALWKR